MNNYIYDFLKSNLEETTLIFFYETFSGRIYIRDYRYSMRKQKVLELWEKYKMEKLYKKQIFAKISKEVSYILPTSEKQVENIIYGKNTKHKI